MNAAIIKKEDLENIFDNQLYMYESFKKNIKYIKYYWKLIKLKNRETQENLRWDHKPQPAKLR